MRNKGRGAEKLKAHEREGGDRVGREGGKEGKKGREGQRGRQREREREFSTHYFTSQTAPIARIWVVRSQPGASPDLQDGHRAQAVGGLLQCVSRITGNQTRSSNAVETLTSIHMDVGTTKDELFCLATVPVPKRNPDKQYSLTFH